MTRLTILKDALVQALGFTADLVASRNTIPILSNIKLSVTAGMATFSATNLDQQGETSLAVLDAGEGAITLPARLLHDMSRKLPAGADINIDWSGKTTAVLRSGRSRTTFQTLPAEDFPELADGTYTTTVSMPAATLARLLSQTGFAQSKEETRYYLNGIYLHSADGKLKACATDGHRLALCVADVAGLDTWPGIILPRDAIKYISKMLAGHKGDVTVDVSSAKLRLTIGANTFTTKLIDGTFPDYERVIPRNNSARLTVKREDLADAVDRVATISLQKSRAVKFEPASGTLTLSVRSADSGEAEEALDVEYTGQPMQIGMNSEYVASVLSAFEGDTVVMHLQDAGSPVLVTSTETQDTTCVIMPMRV